MSLELRIVKWIHVLLEHLNTYELVHLLVGWILLNSCVDYISLSLLEEILLRGLLLSKVSIDLLVSKPLSLLPLVAFASLAPVLGLSRLHIDAPGVALVAG